MLYITSPQGAFATKSYTVFSVTYYLELLDALAFLLHTLFFATKLKSVVNDIALCNSKW